MDIFKELQQLTSFLLAKTYGNGEKTVPTGFLEDAFERTLTDSVYHYEINAEEVLKKICSNSNQLPLFLYRLGRTIFENDPANPVLSNLHWIMREVCCCELYFSTRIDEGFLPIHVLGTVIGSRNTIGKGFVIYQGCTIGHKDDHGAGSKIGNNVTMYANSQILGELTIGDNTVIGCNSLVLNDVPAYSVAKGSPAVSSMRKDAGLK